MTALSSLLLYVMACLCIVQSPIVHGRHIRKHHKEPFKRNFINHAPSSKDIVPFASKRQYGERAGSFKINDGEVFGAGIYEINPKGLVTVDIKLHIKPENSSNTAPSQPTPSKAPTTVLPSAAPTTSSSSTSASTTASTTASSATGTATSSSTTSKVTGPTTPSKAPPTTLKGPSPTGPSSIGASPAVTSPPTGLSDQSEGFLKKFDGQSINTSKEHAEMTAKWNGDDTHIGDSNHGKSAKSTDDAKILGMKVKSGEELKQENQPEKTNFEHSIEIPEAVVPMQFVSNSNSDHEEKRPESVMNAGHGDENLPGNGASSSLSSAQVPELNRLKEALSDAASNWVFNLKEGRNDNSPVPEYVHQNFAPVNIGDWRKQQQYQQWGRN